MHINRRYRYAVPLAITATLMPIQAAVGGIISSESCLPPQQGDPAYVGSLHARYDATALWFKDPSHHRFLACTTPPTPDKPGPQPHGFMSTIDVWMSIDNGVTYSFVSAPADVEVLVTWFGDNSGAGFSPSTPGYIQSFALEMVKLDMMLPSLMLREDPDDNADGVPAESLGEATIELLDDGNYKIDSFFDIFTEISLDDGQTWHNSVDADGNAYASRVVLVPTPAPLLLMLGGLAWQLRGVRSSRALRIRLRP